MTRFEGKRGGTADENLQRSAWDLTAIKKRDGRSKFRDRLCRQRVSSDICLSFKCQIIMEGGVDVQCLDEKSRIHTDAGDLPQSIIPETEPIEKDLILLRVSHDSESTMQQDDGEGGSDRHEW